MVPTVEIAPGYSIPRVIIGAWQLSRGHSRTPLDRREIFRTWAELLEQGFTTFDCADIYPGVEASLGEFRRQARDPTALRVHTKLVPDRDDLARVDRAYVERIVDRSLARLGVERLDLVQLHWWDYGVPGYLEAAGWLGQLVDAGKVRHLGVTNFDTPRLTELLDRGARPVSIQLQFSVLDRRPARSMADLCRARGVHLLCYGSVAGGFLSERWLGRPEPDDDALDNRSLVKYRLIIDEFGGWARFQRLLSALSAIARRAGTDIATVATRWVLERPMVAAVIVGVRGATYAPALRRLLDRPLEEDDRTAIEEAVRGAAGPSGDVYELEREPRGPHAAIMRYNQNREGEL
jgi:aryl-alcohol dehydrogenase-like predicted oxidoreductase